jgi:CheY-like chemotaxis protein
MIDRVQRWLRARVWLTEDQQLPPVNAFVSKRSGVALFSQTHRSNGESVIRCPSKICHMDHSRARNALSSEPSARLTYDDLFSNVTEDLTGTETILLVEDDDSDVAMPGLTGVDVVTRVQRRFNDAAALLMSGRLSQALFEDGILRNGTPFIQKPFVADALARKVREVLDGPPPPAAADPSRHDGV